MDEERDPDRLVLRRDAVRQGWSDDDLARLVRGQQWCRRRGAYLDGPAPVDAARRHRLLVEATVAALRRPAVVSHQSAAVLLGLPMWDVAQDRVHVTRAPSGGATSAARCTCTWPGSATTTSPGSPGCR